MEEQYPAFHSCTACGRKHRVSDCPYGALPAFRYTVLCLARSLDERLSCCFYLSGTIGRQIAEYVDTHGVDALANDDRFTPPSTQPMPAEATRRRLVRAEWVAARPTQTKRKCEP